MCLQTNQLIFNQLIDRRLDHFVSEVASIAVQFAPWSVVGILQEQVAVLDKEVGVRPGLYRGHDSRV